MFKISPSNLNPKDKCSRGEGYTQIWTQWLLFSSAYRKRLYNIKYGTVELSFFLTLLATSQAM